MASNKIEYLPIEIISIILEDESISITDIIRFKSTCKRLQQTTLRNYFWKKKFYQRCPTARKYCAQKPKNTFDYLNFEELIKIGMKHVKKIQYYVSLMSDNNLSATDKKELESFLLYIVGNCKLTYYFVLDEINRISSAQCHLSWSKYGQILTVKYNLKLIVNFLNLYRYTYNNIKHFYKPTINSPLLERLITIIVQYLQPHVSYSVIKMWLDNISLEVLDRLKIKHPEHPIFSTSVEQFLFWKYNNINDHFWNPTETMQIMCELEKYIFSEVDIHKLLQLLRMSDLEDKYIDYISEFFSKYLLIIVYHSVARRLGIYCILHPICTIEYLSLKNDLVIIWKQRYNTETGDNADYFYIQKVSDLIYPSNIVKGKYHVYDLLPPKMDDNKWLFEVTYNNMVQYIKKELENNHCINYKWQFKMISNILKNIERSTVMHSACFYDDVWIKDYYEQITNVIQVRSDKKQSKKMQEGIKFAVGMIVMYPSRDLHCFHNAGSPTYEGVIIGWHDKCEIFSPRGIDMLPFLNDYVVTNFVHRTTLNPNEPHYIILAENNAVCYVAEGHISKCPPKEINNIEIGRFFYRFDGTHYVPNKNLEQKYPYSTQYHMECHVTNFGKCLLGQYVDDWSLPFLDLEICCQICCSE